ncbi:helix-turn-helix domain-containing protein [Rhizobium sp. CECT 9324]|uniref:helix-turn-helix domain-containing protein n=1 Tax=Rhizobium sp. CECT 9324 TaxID=2845820 RepID=UPI001E5F706D|nr:helix-turn-helix domain-containing protein [Rhizobium sp. CECT 9324]
MSADKSYLKPIGQRLIALRTQLGFRNREQFAEAFGAPRKTFEKYEQGLTELPTRLMLWLSSEHHVNLDWLLTGEGQMFEGAVASYNEAVIDKIAGVVTTVYDDANVRLPREKIAGEAVALYNDLIGKVDDINDLDEIIAMLPWLQMRLTKRLREAKMDPGTGKREAS